MTAKTSFGSIRSEPEMTVAKAVGRDSVSVF